MIGRSGAGRLPPNSCTILDLKERVSERLVVAVENAFRAFSKELRTRSVRPQLRQLPQPGWDVSRECINELGYLVGSAKADSAP